MDKRTYYQLIPERVLDSIEEIEKMLPIRDIKGYRRIYLYQIISVVAFNTRKEGDATALMTAHIKKAVPQGYVYLKALLDAGAVERLGRYKAGESAYKYRFATGFNSILKRKLLTDPKLIRRIENNRIKQKRINKFGEQTKYIKQLKINVSVFDYLDLIEHEIKCNKDLNKFNAALASSVKIHNKDIFYSVDDTSRRYHSNLTNLPTSLRQFITINGEYLANVDIKNSQPLIASLLLTNPGKCAPFATDENFVMFLKSLQPINTEDSNKFIQLVTSGLIYEYLMKEFAQYNLRYDRVKMKKQFLIILFARNTIQNKQRKIFAELFPFVHNRFVEVRGNSKSKSRFKNSKRFAILLQTIESHIILGKILPRIYREYPKVIAVSIHDSVCTSIATSDITTVRRIMEEELSHFISLQPTLRVERPAFSSINNNIGMNIKDKKRWGKGTNIGDQYVSKTFVSRTELAS